MLFLGDIPMLKSHLIRFCILKPANIVLSYLNYICIFCISHYLAHKMDYVLSDLLCVNTVLLSECIMKTISLHQ